MRSRKTVFCEIAFWDLFSKYYPTSMPFPDDQSQQRIRAWFGLYSFLSRSRIIFNLSEADFIVKVNNDTRLKYLWKKATEGQCKIDFDSGVFIPFNDSERFLTSVVLTKDNFESKCADYGIININESNFSIKSQLFIDNGVAIRNGEEWDWCSIKDHMVEKESNSMVIVDNYIFGREKHNLYRLLDSILPSKCSVPYHLSVFYLIDREYQAETLIKSERDFRDNLKRIRPTLNCSVEFFQTKRDQNNAYKTDFHDRALITNNIWIDSGAGFLISERRFENCMQKYYSTKSTTIRIAYPFFCSDNVKSVDEGYTNLIEDAKKSILRMGKTTSNRLLG